MAAGEVKIDPLADPDDTLTSAIPLNRQQLAKHVQLQEPAYHNPQTERWLRDELQSLQEVR